MSLLLLFRPSEGAPEPPGDPVLKFFDQPTPSGGIDSGAPGAAAYDQPTPGTVRV